MYWCAYVLFVVFHNKGNVLYAIYTYISCHSVFMCVYANIPKQIDYIIVPQTQLQTYIST